MPDPLRILTAPVRVAAPTPPAQVATFVAADALRRRAVATGRPAEWLATEWTGDLAGQHAVERDLAREGLDRATLGRDGFVERLRSVEAERRSELAAVLHALRVDVEPAVADEALARAASVAFARLYEAGLVERAERVVATCPRCETVVERADAEPADLDVDVAAIRLPVSGAEDAADGGDALVVRTHEPELLPGVVAVAVPPDHPLTGRSVEVPIAGRAVPVVGADGVADPQLVVPAHHAAHLEAARPLGLPAVEVLDDAGTVTAAGPLHGLGRFAARAAALEILDGSGELLGTKTEAVPALRCRRCRTVLVARLGPHWFLRSEDLEIAAADAVRQGDVVVEPAAARDALLERASHGGDWCLSHQVWGGVPVPAARCVECGGEAVGADLSRCSRCAGELRADDSVLDARFVAAIWPLAAAGWPDRLEAGALAEGVAVVGDLHIPTWVLPGIALGLRLAGSAPFGRVAVQRAGGIADPATPDVAGSGGDGAAAGVATPALVDLVWEVAEHGAGPLRLALAAALDLDRALDVCALLDDPPPGDVDIAPVVEAAEAAYASGTPGEAIPLAAAALEEGVSPGAADRLRAVLSPVTGE